ncbi:MAG: hypothetical protein LBS56_08760 [Propionibacteriaceae bacterium]|jgi:hypothetical protein|nr:hypothetical protein [Propionibacteriaceae bacterium]
MTDPTALTAWPRVRRVLNMVNLTTPTGLLVAAVGHAARRPGPDGLTLAEGYRFRFPTGGAFTVGNVVITRLTFADLTRRWPNLLRHEARHATQYAILGVLFWPTYAATMGWSLLRTGDRAARCALERWAGLADGGYEDVPPRRVCRPSR